MTTAEQSTSTVFFSSASKLIDKLRQSKKLMVELNFYSEGRRQFAFEVPPLDWSVLPAKAQPVATGPREVFCLELEDMTECFGELKICELQSSALSPHPQCTSFRKSPCKLGNDNSCRVMKKKDALGGEVEVTTEGR